MEPSSLLNRTSSLTCSTPDLPVPIAVPSSSVLIPLSVIDETSAQSVEIESYKTNVPDNGHFSELSTLPPIELSCRAPFCARRSLHERKKDVPVIFYQFPVGDIPRCKIWVDFCGMSEAWNGNNTDVFENYYLCSDHFEPKFFSTLFRPRLLPSAVPTIIQPDCDAKVPLISLCPSTSKSTLSSALMSDNIESVTAVSLSNITLNEQPEHTNYASAMVQDLPALMSTSSGSLSLISSVSSPNSSESSTPSAFQTGTLMLTEDKFNLNKYSIRSFSFNNLLVQPRLPVKTFCCKAPFCRGKYVYWNREHIGNKSFFKFPVNDVEICKIWVEFCNMSDAWERKPNLFKRYYLCSDHFELKYLSGALNKRRLLKSAVPTLKQGGDPTCIRQKPTHVTAPPLQTSFNDTFPAFQSASAHLAPAQSCKFSESFYLESKLAPTSKKVLARTQKITSKLSMRRNKLQVLDLSCKAPFCTNKYSREKLKCRPNKSFFKFPIKDVSTCKIWADFCNLSDVWIKRKVQFKKYLLCSDHFESKYFIDKTKKSGLLKLAVPTIKHPEVAFEVLVTTSPLMPSLVDDKKSLQVTDDNLELSDQASLSEPSLIFAPLIVDSSVSSLFVENSPVNASVTIVSNLNTSPEVEYSCCAPFCNNKYLSGNNSSCRNFFEFPLNDPTRCVIWEKFCQDETIANDGTVDTESYKNRYLCSDHFELKYFTSIFKDRLLCSAVPTIKYLDGGQGFTLSSLTAVSSPSSPFSYIPSTCPRLSHRSLPKSSLLMSTAPIQCPLLLTSSLNTPIVNSCLLSNTPSPASMSSTFIPTPLSSVPPIYSPFVELLPTTESVNYVLADDALLVNSCNPNQNSDIFLSTSVIEIGEPSTSVVLPTQQIVHSEIPILSDDSQLPYSSELPSIDTTPLLQYDVPSSSLDASSSVPNAIPDSVSLTDSPLSESPIASPASISAIIKPVLYSYSDHTYARGSTNNSFKLVEFE